ncbi:MAG TPA: bL35 family ribosomal protein [Abditibacterium sp.]|jgi:large subunit ribosomal protein L35
MGNKQKTHKGTAKRISTTGTGKLKRRKVGLAHLQTKRASNTQMRNNNGAQSVAKADVKAMRAKLAS